MSDPCPNDTNGDGDCGRKTCARCYPQYQPAPTGPGRWIELVPVEVFGLMCDDHETPRPAPWGLMDAVQAWSDCNRADGRIYRVEDLPGPRRPGETARVWVPDEAWPFFEKRWGEGYPTGDDVASMMPPSAPPPRRP